MAGSIRHATHIGADRKHGRTERNEAFQHTRKRVALLDRRLAKVHRSRNVRGAVQILAARIDQVYGVARNARRRLDGRTVVGHGGVRPDGADRLEAKPFEVFALAVSGVCGCNSGRGVLIKACIVHTLGGHLRSKSGQPFGSR